MAGQSLTALPVFNEANHIADVLPHVIRHSEDVLVVNDGSSDGTASALKPFANIHVIHHPENQGYGAALRSAFHFAQERGYESLVTIDCDGQHEPKLVPRMVERLNGENEGNQTPDIVSGSRYLKMFEGDSQPPAARRQINRRITAILNDCLGWNLTDAFCGFKAYRVASLAAFNVTELGYAMPLQHLVQAAAARLEIVEYPVPLVYLEEERSFGGSLDNADQRLQYYLQVLARELDAHQMPIPPDVRQAAVCP